MEGETATTGEIGTGVLRVGSRDSKLALIQTQLVIDKLQQTYPKLTIKLETMKTIGDKIQDVAMSKIGDKGLFTKELEIALASNAVDLVVHSLKDMPTLLPDNMMLAAITAREDPRDAVVMAPRHADKRKLADLPPNSTVGTGSVRRVAQLQRQYPLLKFKDIRGNLTTRLNKLDAEDSPYDAIVLAYAGLYRQGLEARIVEKLDAVLPAVGQGAMGVEVRCDDQRTLALVSCVNDTAARLECLAERQLMRALEGGCSVPIGVKSRWEGSQLYLHGIVAAPGGEQAVEAETSGCVDGQNSEQDAVALGARLAQLMRDRGADEILNSISS
ncbi:porphobilinogen deaminase [Coemansia guatemalensis]|uniref:hydroxymethylbilane synthase n=1 Tax=Coemansia guatemalensis TaxID=2761395 RepID=A0A9W8I591_9FUNG|nr:porphobilinogen deaminase [Coemansia guatemalensis]